MDFYNIFTEMYDFWWNFMIFLQKNHDFLWNFMIFSLKFMTFAGILWYFDRDSRPFVTFKKTF